MDAVGLARGNPLQTAHPVDAVMETSYPSSLLQAGGRGVSVTNNGGRKRCPLSRRTQPLHRFHTPLNTSLLLYQYLQLGSPAATALASDAHDGGRRREAWEGPLATPAQWSSRWVLPARSRVPRLCWVFSAPPGQLAPPQLCTDLGALDSGVLRFIQVPFDEPDGWSSAKAQCPATNRLGLHALKGPSFLISLL